MLGQFLGALCIIVFSLGAARADAYADYVSIRVAIQSGIITPELKKLAVRMWPIENRFQKDLSKLATAQANSCDSINLLLLNTLRSNAYFSFTFIRPNKDVLFDFLTAQHKFIYSVPPADAQTQPGSIFAWFVSDLARAAVYGYQATRDQRFIDMVIDDTKRAFDNTDQKLGFKDSFGHDELEGWSLFDHGKPGREETLPGRILSPILRLAVIAKTDRAIDPGRKDEIDVLANHAVKLLKPYLKYQVIDGNRRYWRYLWDGKEDATNHMSAFAEAAAHAYKLTGDTAFRDSAVGYRYYFLSNVRKLQVKYGGKNFPAYTWLYQVVPHPTDLDGERMYKGSITTTGLVNIEDGGIALAREDQIGITNSFRFFVSGPLAIGLVNGLMSPRAMPLSGYNSYRGGTPQTANYTSFIYLDRWISDVRGIILTTIASRTDLFPDGLLGSPSDAAAYAYRLARPMEVLQPPAGLVGDEKPPSAIKRQDDKQRCRYRNAER